MHQDSARHTIAIFERLYNYVESVLPIELNQDVVSALEQVKNNYELSVEEIEDTMITFGRYVWPYRKAFEEFLAIYEGRVGEQFMLSHSSVQIKKRYQDFKLHGGSLRDLHSGRPANFFTSEERVKLCEVLVNMNQSLRKHVVQLIKSTESKKFKVSVAEFAQILLEIEQELGFIRCIADSEQEHPQLASEMRAQVRGFDHGFCLLGPEVDFIAVCNMRGHFEGRKKEMKVRGYVFSDLFQ